MNKNRVGIVLCIIGIIFAIISLALAISGVDVKIVCAGIFLTLCFVLLGIVFNNKNNEKS